MKESDEVPVYLALGSNMGDRKAYLIKALILLAGTDGVRVNNISPLYETTPVGLPDGTSEGVPAGAPSGAEQGAFLNMACRLEVTLPPLRLLAILQDIETKLERKRLVRWGPRTIDLDILLYGSETIQTETLTVPHPRMFERAFVLTPLRDVYPLPEIEGISFTERIASCADKDGIRYYGLPPSIPFPL